jgi:hypothetical protein
MQEKEERLAQLEAKYVQARAIPAESTRRAARNAAHQLRHARLTEGDAFRLQLKASLQSEEARQRRIAEEEQLLQLRAEAKQEEPDAMPAEAEAAEAPAARGKARQASNKANKKKKGAAAPQAAAAEPPVSRRAGMRARTAVDYTSALVTTESKSTPASAIHEPRSYAEAMRSPQREQWLAAMRAEEESLRAHAVWRRVPLAEAHREGRTPIGCKWIYKLKLNSAGEVERYKARLVARGFTQQRGLDYTETFAPTLLYKTFRVLLTVAAVLDFELNQLDVETAFLYGELLDTVYMQLPPGLQLEAASAAGERVVRGGGGSARTECVRLLKALYGTKQASHVWHASLDRTLRKLGFRPATADPCVYTRPTASGESILLGVFVDDILAAHSQADASEWAAVKSQLCATYRNAIKDLGSAEWVLGMKITRDRSRRTLELSQQRYIEKMLHEFGLEDAKAVPTPEVAGHGLSKADEAQSDAERVSMQSKPYLELVGSLLYATLSTRPDCAHAVAMLSRFMQSPGEACWIAAKRVLRFLKGTKHVGLQFGWYPEGRGNAAATHATAQAEPPNSLRAFPSTVTMYCDADWAGDVDDRKSTSGCVVLLAGNVVSWSSKKQATVALSTAEAEYMAMSAAVQEGKWLAQLLREIGCAPQLPMRVLCDNQAAIRISASDTSSAHTRCKHIDVRHHYIREAHASGTISVEWVATSDQWADVCTKGLSSEQFHKLHSKIMKAV